MSSRFSPALMTCGFLIGLMGVTSGCGSPGADSETAQQVGEKTSGQPDSSEVADRGVESPPPAAGLPDAGRTVTSQLGGPGQAGPDQPTSRQPTSRGPTSRGPGSQPGDDEIAVFETAETERNGAAVVAKPSTGTDVALDPIPEVRLREDLSAEKLREFLVRADQDLELIHSGRSGIEGLEAQRAKLVQISQMKLEAARRLAKHDDADDAARSDGLRGEMQALSHLAMLSDVQAADELERLATENLSASDPSLVSDSRAVLIGFATEALHNGDRDGDAVERILKLVNSIATSPIEPDMPSMIAMGKARDVLTNYGHHDEAKQVRDSIIELFADSPNPDIAKAAAEFAGSVRYDGVTILQEQILEGAEVPVEQWSDAVETLIDESPDLQTVRYLAGAAVEFESIGLDPLVDATFDVLTRRFTDTGSANHREIQIAIRARATRQEVMGRPFQSDLRGVGGRDVDITDYLGKVVLMPFWASGLAPSLQPIPKLVAIRDKSPDRIAIVGVNLDNRSAPLADFISRTGIDFPSFYASTPQAASEIATEFGMVSLPFVLVLDQKGRVAAVHLTDRDLGQTVQALIDDNE